MPAVFEPAFIKLLFQLFTGAATAPATIYMGLGGPGGSAEVSAGDGNGNSSGYARVAIPVSSLTINSSGSTLTVPPQTFSFSAIPSPNNGANSWFLADALTGGNVYCSGTLGGDGAGGVMAIASGQGAIVVAASTAALFKPGDTLKLGSVCANNLEYSMVSNVDGSDAYDQQNGTASIYCGTAHAHPAGEAFTRDSTARFYSAGWVETVNATITIVSAP